MGAPGIVLNDYFSYVSYPLLHAALFPTPHAPLYYGDYDSYSVLWRELGAPDPPR